MDVDPLYVSHNNASFMLRCGLPIIMLHALDYICQINVRRPTSEHHWGRELDFLEVFSGSANLTRACRSAGLVSQSYDIRTRGPVNDILKVEGLLAAARDVLRLRKRAVLWGGIPCSSWIFMSSNATGRYDSIMGKDTTTVKTANKITSRFCLLICIALARDVHWLVEQPGGSLLMQFPLVDYMLRLGGHAHRLWMGAYGHCRPKRTLLFGSVTFIYALNKTIKPNDFNRSNSSKLVTRKKRDGRVRVTGKKHALRSSGIYPAEFCDTIAGQIETHLATGLPGPHVDLSAVDNGIAEEMREMWGRLADLEDLREFLIEEQSRGRFTPFQAL